MARRLTITDGGHELTFEVRKMPASEAEDFLYQAAALAGKNLDFDSSLDGKDLVRALVAAKHEDAKALLDVLLGCVAYVKGKAVISLSYDNIDGIITSPLTIMKLRVEAARENFGFLFDELQSLFRDGQSTSETAGR